MKLQIVAQTDLGKIRTLNEDNYLVINDLGIEHALDSDGQFEQQGLGSVLIVADGMGGEESGEIASEIAKQSISAYIIENFTDPDFQFSQIIEILKNSLLFAHDQIVSYVKKHSESFGMGTTALVSLIFRDHLFVAWVGDSRMYRYGINGRITSHNYFEGNLEILTNDHSVVWGEVLRGNMTPEEARVAPQSNIITQSLGDVFKSPAPDSHIYPVYQNDIILMCSDGLNGMLSDLEINKVFASNDDLKTLSSIFIEGANANGGHDNITLILCKIVKGIELASDKGNVTIEIKDKKDDNILTNDEMKVDTDQSKNIESEPNRISVLDNDDLKKNNRPKPFTILLFIISLGLLAYSIYYFQNEKKKIEVPPPVIIKQDSVSKDSLPLPASNIEKIEKKEAPQVEKQNNRKQVDNNKVKLDTQKNKLPKLRVQTIEIKQKAEKIENKEITIKTNPEIAKKIVPRSTLIKKLDSLIRLLPQKYEKEVLQAKYDKIKKRIASTNLQDTIKLKQIIIEIQSFQKEIK